MVLQNVVFFSLCLAIINLLNLPFQAHGALARLPTLAEQESKLQDRDFVFNLGGSEPLVDGSGGRQFFMGRENFPALNLKSGRSGWGGSQALFRFAPCGFRTPHYHPRGTENFYVISGNIRANFLRENGQVVVNDVSDGFAGFFPEAHVHFVQNFGCTEAVTLSTFGVSDEGTINVASSLRLPRDTIQLALGNKDLSPSDELLKDVMIQSQKCLERCKMQKKKKM